MYAVLPAGGPGAVPRRQSDGEAAQAHAGRAAKRCRNCGRTRPAAVAAVVSKSMAKRPEDRYQKRRRSGGRPGVAEVAPATAREGGGTLAKGVAVAALDGATEVVAANDVGVSVGRCRRRRAAEGWRRLALYTVGGLLSLGVGVWLLTLFLRFALPPRRRRESFRRRAAPQPVATSSPAFDVWLKKVEAPCRRTSRSRPSPRSEETQSPASTARSNRKSRTEWSLGPVSMRRR